MANINLPSLIDALESHYKQDYMYLGVFIGAGANNSFHLYCRNARYAKECRELLKDYDNIEYHVTGKIVT